ncbi:hypothetical protein QR680_001521 [Steinernema hermaphroditum]|uniref:lysoplasmalogenase n=1 Tax=Steinernema hermaphroditum TaxID=289476 RepID=A0AA39LG74_9BILA|nr:hypothetical protein QR680_001521 [Steinernema hermaphroditum]
MSFVRNSFFPYVALVALFYVQSSGFVKFHDNGYAYWKVLPVTTLGMFMYFFATVVPEKERRVHAFGLLLGALGDFLIGQFENGIVTGAIAFGTGHIFYLSTFARRIQKPTYALVGGILIYGIVLNHFCLMPNLGAHPMNTVILLVYSLILSSAVIISGSMYIEGTKEKMSSLGPMQMCLIYGAFVLLVYIETDRFMVDAPMLSALPVVVLGLMTLTVNMAAKPKLLTTLYFLLSAHGIYRMSTSRFYMEWSAMELGLANIFYLLSFINLLRKLWIYLAAVTSLYLVGFAYFCFADLFSSIPFLVLMLTFGATVISASMVCAGSVWRYSAQFTDARQASLMRFGGLMLNLTCTSAFLFSQFATRKHQMLWFMNVAHYVAQLLLCLANERTF